MGKITGTPFRSNNPRVLRRTNRKIRRLIDVAEFKKKQILLKDLKDKIKVKGFQRRRPGAIE